MELVRFQAMLPLNETLRVWSGLLQSGRIEPERVDLVEIDFAQIDRFRLLIAEPRR